MKRGIIAVHGMGVFKRGDFLLGLVVPLARYLESKGGKVDFEPEIGLGFRSDDDTPAEVTLKVRESGGFDEEWDFREAFYDQSFSPPTLGQVLRWGSDLIDEEVDAIAKVFENPLNTSPTDHCHDNRNKPDTCQYPGRTKRLYVAQAGIFKAVAKFVAWAGPTLLFLVWLLLLLRGIPPLPAFLTRVAWVARVASWVRTGVNALANLLVPFAVNIIGDVKSFIDNPAAADAMRSSVEDIFLDMLQDDEIQSITILAHSLGGLVSYDVLTEARPIDMHLRANPDQRNVAGTQTCRYISWVTVGAAMNRGFSITGRPAGAHASQSLRSPIASIIRDPKIGTGQTEQPFFWLSIFARYDWVPAGSVSSGFFEATEVDCKQFKERLVVNVDRPIADHHAYWKNYELVWPRIVRAIHGGTYPWPQTALSDEKSQQLICEKTIRIGDRRMPFLVLLVSVLVVLLPVAILVSLPTAIIKAVSWSLARARRVL